jgi:DNA-binding XRE family transcriptional regulator
MLLDPAVTQEDLSARLAVLGVGIVRTGIAKIENGERYVLDYEARAFAKALRVPIEQLYERPRSA